MKLHLSMRVADLDEAIAFYSGLFGQEPTILRDGYAKWDVTDPAVNFVVQDGAAALGLDHLGIQVDTQEELATLTDRLRGLDRPMLDVEATTCCYAKMDKAWIKGEADEKWEAFLTHSHNEPGFGTDRAHLLDTVAGTEETGTCCGKPKPTASCCAPASS
ncbi:MAG: ArsI/CadI family heavy metal resistance metalloenzyme [Pseudomonadota bacterium]